MTEEEQIAYAMQVPYYTYLCGVRIKLNSFLIFFIMSQKSKCLNVFVVQMSMAENDGGDGGSEEKMEVDDKDQDYSEVSCTSRPCLF